MSRNTDLPCLSAVDFYRLNEGELISALANAIAAHAEQNSSKELSREQEVIWAWGQMSMDVPNGGFTQFFYNHRGDEGVAALADLLDSIALSNAADLVREALAVYRRHRSAFAVDNPWEGLFGSIQEFEKIERAFERIIQRCDRAIEKWLRSKISELATDSSGEPFDPSFSGAVENKYSIGAVSEYLEVKKGKPHGAYRQFFDDGTVRKVVFYKSGKVSGDFWPNGQLKRKQSKRGDDTVIEWFYPSGKLQKHLVKDKGNYIIEPVRMFHENGRVAELLTVVKNKKSGPWLKFFDDGSPQLQAEFGPGEKPIVHNAWDEDRQQTVKDGSGCFYFDGHDIQWEYSLFLAHDWQHETELKDGVSHGKETTYFAGVLWSVSFYEYGVQQGESTVYWNNGRVRSVTSYSQGKKGATHSFPKFDQPAPAVLLSAEANEKLYAAWGHVAVDEYPRVLNLAEVQKQLKVPDFLREVHERNLAHTIKSDYEDCNTFNDGVAYFLTVNEAGEVTQVKASGSGVYSAGHWGVYPPLLQMLQFAPGRVRGRAVECRVLAKVDHTFVEGRNQ